MAARPPLHVQTRYLPPFVIAPNQEEDRHGHWDHSIQTADGVWDAVAIANDAEDNLSCAVPSARFIGRSAAAAAAAEAEEEEEEEAEGALEEAPGEGASSFSQP